MAGNVNQGIEQGNAKHGGRTQVGKVLFEDMALADQRLGCQNARLIGGMLSLRPRATIKLPDQMAVAAMAKR